jgi:hypothetical protein
MKMFFVEISADASFPRKTRLNLNAVWQRYEEGEVVITTLGDRQYDVISL